MMLSPHYQKNTMLKSLELLKRGYLGLTSASCSEQSSSQELKPVQSELKNHIKNRVKQLTSGMPLQPIITSTVDQALDGTTDADLLDVIRKASDELIDILELFDGELGIKELRELIGNGELRDLASNQIGTE